MSRRPRVLHLITDAAENEYFRVLTAHAESDRFELEFVSLEPSGALQAQMAAAQVESLALGAARRRAYPRALMVLARHLRRREIDLLHCHLLDACVVGLAAARLARTRAAVMTAHHSHEIPLHERRSLTAVDRLIARGFDGVISPSAQMKDTLVQFHGVPESNVEVIHHGFELDRFDPRTTARDAVRDELGLTHRLVVGSIGRLYWIKNQAALVEAFAALEPAYPDAVLVLVGAGDQGSIRSHAAALGIEDKTIVLPRRPDVADVLAAMDVFVLPSLAESFGQVIVEAMASGKPVVSTPVGIAPELLSATRAGVLAADAGPQAIEAALRTALARRGDWPEMATESRRLSLAFGAEDMVRRYESYYERVLEGAPGGSQRDHGQAACD